MRKLYGICLLLIVASLWGSVAVSVANDRNMRENTVPAADILQDEDPDYEAMQLELDELRRAEEELEQQRRERKVTGEEYEQRRQSLFGRLASLMMLADRGSFLLEGEVVDEHGNPLDGVKLTVVRTRMTGVDRSRSRTDEHKVDGSFRVRTSGYDRVSLIFDKGGYYQVRLLFPRLTDEEYDDIDEEFEEGRIRPKRYEHRNLRVEMHSIGEVARIVALGYQPRFSIRDEGVELQLRSFKKIRLPGGGHFLPIQRVTMGADEIPEAAVYLVPALYHSGMVP